MGRRGMVSTIKGPVLLFLILIVSILPSTCGESLRSRILGLWRSINAGKPLVRQSDPE